MFSDQRAHRTDADTRLRIGAFGALVSLLFTVSFGGRAACGGPVPVRHDPRGHFPSVSLHPRRRLCPLAPVTWMLGKSGGRASAEACFPCWAASGVTTSSVSWWFPAAPLPDPSPFCRRVCRVSSPLLPLTSLLTLARTWPARAPPRCRPRSWGASLSCGEPALLLFCAAWCSVFIWHFLSPGISRFSTAPQVLQWKVVPGNPDGTSAGHLRCLHPTRDEP